MPDRPGLLLTGATGVVGSALLPLLDGFDVLALTHHAQVEGPSVRGDLTCDRLGLDDPTYRDLVARTSLVVHTAAITDFGVGEPGTSALNVGGTRRVLELAERAGARMLYVSTAFVARSELTTEARGGSNWEAGISPAAYLESKRQAEDLVRGSGLPTTIARPSVIIGHSVTGAMTRFQGLHAVLRALMRNELPVMPVPGATLVDMVPVDVVAAAIAALVDAGLPGGEHWLTAGAAAMTVEDLAGACVRHAHALGLAAETPRFVTRDMVERLLRPVFIDPLPARQRRRFDDLAAMTAMFADAPEFPTSLGSIPGGPPSMSRPDSDKALESSIAWLAEKIRLGSRGAA